MSTLLKIHPAIGIARLGDGTTAFYISPERTGDLPIACDREGNTTLGADGEEERVSAFKDDARRIARQAARFRIDIYPDGGGPGRELCLGETIEVTDTLSGKRIKGEVVDIRWTVYLANKKASFYAFQQLEGEHGYSADHPLRNPEITGDGPRRRLIIDPGPCTVRATPASARRAAFARWDDPAVPQTFPPPLLPYSIDTLGDLLVSQQDNHARLLVLGGHGRSGSMHTGFGEPQSTSYANNDGWFDDTSDGPVSAQIEINVQEVNGLPPATGAYGHVLFPVQCLAWVIVGYQRYAPQITDIVTMDETIFDTAVRFLAYRPEIFGVPPFDRTAAANRPHTAAERAAWRRSAQWNHAYYPHFWRDIWPILTRPDRYKWVMDFDPTDGGDPHNPTPGAGGVFDPTLLSVPPDARQDAHTIEALRQRRQMIFETLRKPGQENAYQLPTHPSRPGTGPIGMPDLCGDNPISNTAASKFLCLSETVLFLLEQWANGTFINERAEQFADADRGVLGNVLGGSFCPGAETGWILRNPAIYSEPYRIRHRPGVTPGSLSLDIDLAHGMEPGDITRYSSIPWQADFNECSSQDVDITYERWNQIAPAGSGDPTPRVIQPIYWWPAHRPMEVFVRTPSGPGAPIVPLSTAVSQVLTHGVQVAWSRGIPQSYMGDLMMVTAWRELGFIVQNDDAKPGDPTFIEVESDLPTA